MIPLLLASLLASPFSGSGSVSGPALVSAHGGLANYTVGDVWYPGNSITRLDTSPFPSTPIRGASSPNIPSTPESVYRYSSFPYTHRALASSPISASAVSAGSSSPATPVPAHFVPIVIPPGTNPYPITVFAPPTPPAMTPRELFDFEENRIAKLVHAVLERWEKDAIGRVLEERRRNEDQQERARVVRNEQQLRKRLRAQQEAFEQSLKATTSAPAASTPVTAPVARRRTTTKKSTLAREMKSLAQLGGAGNAISLGKKENVPSSTMTKNGTTLV